jgi:hypothetical protein
MHGRYLRTHFNGVLMNTSILSAISDDWFCFCLWCLTPLSTIFHSYIVAVSFIGGENEKATELSEVTDKLYSKRNQCLSLLTL